MSRDLLEVIDRVIGELPPAEGDLIAELRKIQDSAAFTAPEMMYLRWRSATDALIDCAEGKPWAPRVESIWTGRSE